MRRYVDIRYVDVVWHLRSDKHSQDLDQVLGGQEPDYKLEAFTEVSDTLVIISPVTKP